MDGFQLYLRKAKSEAFLFVFSLLPRPLYTCTVAPLKSNAPYIIGPISNEKHIFKILELGVSILLLNKIKILGKIVYKL